MHIRIAGKDFALWAIVLILLVVLLTPVAYGETVKKGLEVLGLGNGNIWDVIKYVFTGGWIKDKLDFVATMRIFFFFFVFTVCFAVLSWLGTSGAAAWLDRRIAIVLALTIAGIGTLFMPLTLLTAMGADYAIVAALIFMAPFIALIVYGIYLTYSPPATFWRVAMRILGIIALIAVVAAIVYMVSLVENAFISGNFKRAITISMIPVAPFLFKRLKWEL